MSLKLAILAKVFKVSLWNVVIAARTAFSKHQSWQIIRYIREEGDLNPIHQGLRSREHLVRIGDPCAVLQLL